MVLKHDLSPSAPWYRLETDESDWAALPAKELVQLYGQMQLIRRFEEKILDLEKAGLVHGPAHASIGQEAAAVGAMSMLRASDQINGTHRAHHQVLTKLVNARAAVQSAASQWRQRLYARCLEQFPGRVLAMPIAENGFTGVALGAALRDLRPVVEIMFSDFCFVVADQIGNDIAKVRHMFGDDFLVPIVMRVRVSQHTGYG